MKRYLIYIAIISLGTLIFSEPPLAQRAYAGTSQSKIAVKPNLKPAEPPQTVKATPSTPAPQTQPQASVFDPNNPTTWPKCEAGQIVRADNGQCAGAIAPVATPTVSSSVAVSVPVPTGSIDGCGDNEYAHYIYTHESGCRTHNPNGSGCDGIGQACPASKVIDQCGYDYACQNAWFTNYANKYGGWQGSYNFWVAHGWW